MNRIFTLVPLVAIALSGCGGKSKEQEALDRIANKPKPGYVRILSTGSKDLTLMHNGQNLGTAPAGGGNMKAYSFAAGEKTVQVFDGGTELFSQKVTVASNEVHTIVVLPDGKHFLLTGELRRPTEDANVTVLVVDASGNKVASPPTFSVSGLLGKKPLDKPNGNLFLGNGEWKSAGGPTEGSASINIEEGMAYTLLFIQSGSSYKPFFLLNTPNEKPAVGNLAG